MSVKLLFVLKPTIIRAVSGPIESVLLQSALNAKRLLAQSEQGALEPGAYRLRADTRYEIVDGAPTNLVEVTGGGKDPPIDPVLGSQIAVINTLFGQFSSDVVMRRLKAAATGEGGTATLSPQPTHSTLHSE